jgi:hypothetical protein
MSEEPALDVMPQERSPVYAMRLVARGAIGTSHSQIENIERTGRTPHLPRLSPSTMYLLLARILRRLRHPEEPTVAPAPTSGILSTNFAYIAFNPSSSPNTASTTSAGRLNKLFTTFSVPESSEFNAEYEETDVRLIGRRRDVNVCLTARQDPHINQSESRSRRTEDSMGQTV